MSYSSQVLLENYMPTCQCLLEEDGWMSHIHPGKSIGEASEAEFSYTVDLCLFASSVMSYSSLTFSSIVLASSLIVMVTRDVHRCWYRQLLFLPKRCSEKLVSLLIESLVTHYRRLQWLCFHSMETQQWSSKLNVCVTLTTVHTPELTRFSPCGRTHMHTRMYLHTLCCYCIRQPQSWCRPLPMK